MAPGAADAAPAAVAFEEYAGPHGARARKLVGLAMQELGRRGLLHRGRKLAPKLRDLGVRVDAVDTSELDAWRAELERGYQLFIDGELEASRALLSQEVARAERFAWRLAAEPDLRRARYRALVALTLLAERAGRVGEAHAFMAELIRSYPERPIERDSFGPRAHGMYAERYRTFEVNGRGRLHIHGARNVRILVNEHAAKSRRTHREGELELDLWPGEYRVLAVFPGGGKRLYRASVRARGTTEVRLHPALATRLSIGPNLKVVMKAGQGTLEMQAARELAGSLSAVGLIGVGVRSVGDGKHLFVTHYDRTGRATRQGSLPVEQAEDPAQLRELMRFATTGEEATGVAVYRGPSEAPSKIPYVLIGGGVAAGGAGLALLLLDGKERCADGTGTCPDVYETESLGWIAVATGATLAAAGAGWLMWGQRDSGPALAIVPTGTGLGLFARF